MKKLFERKELKYILTDQQKEEFLKLIRNDILPDQYPEYSIRSIYYDTDGYDLFRKSLDKPDYKEKLRLRSYQNATQKEDPVFLEIKKKFNGVVYKRRVDFDLEHAEEFLEHPSRESISHKEMATLLRRYPVKPKVYVRYDREAYVWKDDPDFRITFDDNIRYRLKDLELKDKREDELLLQKGLYIMEVKSNVNFPMAFVKALEEVGARPASFSKVGQVYKEKILKRSSAERV